MLKLSVFSIVFILKLCYSHSIRGVSPENINNYQPDINGNWHCLSDPSIIIPFSKINDNYCDCPDGSDEPGTSACMNSKFYCENNGFKPHYIPSFKVDDGICDYDVCCDGSDEAPGICENRCDQLKKENDLFISNHNKLIQDGLLIKTKMIEDSKSKRLDIEQLIIQYKEQINITREEIIKLEEELEKLDPTQEKIVENFNIIESDLSLLSENLLNSFNKLETYISKLELLENILKIMTNEYNHNFNDPAVKQAAQDYLNFAASIDETDESNESQRVQISSLINSFKSVLESTKTDIDKVKTEIVNLSSIKVENTTLDINSKNNNENSNSFISELINALSIGIKQSLKSFLGVESHKIPLEAIKEEPNPDLSSYNTEEKINILKSRLEHYESELRKSETELNKNYGPDDILRSMTDCIDSKIGNYIYRLCPTSVLEQINSDNHGTKIGIFEELVYSEESHNYKFNFKRGARCWNGPIREATIDLVCGLTNEITLVTEPEKCIYQMKMISPLGCFQIDLL